MLTKVIEISKKYTTILEKCDAQVKINDKLNDEIKKLKKQLNQEINNIEQREI